MRKAGILLPIFSLPSDYGIGSLGREAYNFIDFLVRTGQSVWQILPLTSTNPDDYYSPYKSNGAFSGNYDFIDIDMLVMENYLSENFVKNIDLTSFQFDPRYINYEQVRSLKKIFFQEAFKNFNIETNEKYLEFEKENRFWLDDFAKYISLKEMNILKFSNEKEIKEKLDKDKFKYIYNYNKFLQFLFFEQWFKLKKYANKNGIEIFGDIPIYVSDDSSDFYYHKELFICDEYGELKLIAGVPPDDFSDEGQCWGNPLYNWEYLKKNKYSWWVNRIKKSFELYDILRLDHFRGFESFYCIDKKTGNAKNGVWKKAYGKDFFRTLKEIIPESNLKIVAEDLGVITPEVINLLEDTGFPGMKIIQFGFNTDSYNLNLPHTFHKNTVSYTGTHDNATMAEWLLKSNDGALEYAKKYLRLETYNKYTEGFIRAVIGSSSDLAIIPLQDWLDFGEWARINTPSTVGINWKFRILKEDLTEDLERYISYITGLYGRYMNR